MLWKSGDKLWQCGPLGSIAEFTSSVDILFLFLLLSTSKLASDKHILPQLVKYVVLCYLDTRYGVGVDCWVFERNTYVYSFTVKGTIWAFCRLLKLFYFHSEGVLFY